MKNNTFNFLHRLILMIVLLWMPLALKAQTFPNPRINISPTIPLGSAVESHLADLDGDGDLDVVYSYSNHLSWYENLDGLGTYGANQNIGSTPYLSRDIYTTDIDGDGDMDLITISQGGSIIYWHENLDGLGTFGSRQIITTAEYGTISVNAEDLDGDGDMDILSASFLSDRLAWYRNDGLGNFAPQQIISFGYQYRDVYTADLDDDGYIDVLSASSDDNRIAWYKNDGLGNFGTQQTITTLTDEAAIVFAVDMDGDGDQDVLSGSFGDDRIAWFENDGLGTFGSLQNIPLTSGFDLRDVYPGDIDGDGDTDVVSVSHSSANSLIAWHENTDCMGTFDYQETIDDSVWAWGVAVASTGDIDLDGDMDVLAADQATVGVSWYENTTPLVPQINLPDIVIICDGIFEELCGPALGSCGNPTYNWYFNDPNGTSFHLSNDQCYTPSQFGDFILIAQDENGYFLNQTVTVLDGSPEPILGTGGLLCIGEIISIANQGFDNPNYEITWYHNMNVVQQGGVTLMSSFTSGTITVEVTIDGCGTVSTTVEIIECDCPDDLELVFDCETGELSVRNLPTDIAINTIFWELNNNTISGATNTTLQVTEPGTYSFGIIFTLQNGVECHHFIHYTVTEDDCPNTIFCPDDLELAMNCETGELYVENLPSDITINTIFWELNNNIISGATNTTLQVTEPGTYSFGIIFTLSTGVECHHFIHFEYFEEFCCEEVGLNPVATVLNSNESIVLDTPYGPMEVPVIECGLRLDGSLSTCEDSYNIIIQPYNPIDWVPTGPVLYDEWFSGQAPNFIGIPSGVFPISNSGQFYLLTFAVGPTWTPTYIPLWYQCDGEKEDEQTKGLNFSAERITIFPNPTSNIINVTTSFNTGAFQLYDIHGKMMIQNVLQSNTTTVDISEFSTGVYFLKIQSNNGEVHVRKVIKE